MISRKVSQRHAAESHQHKAVLRTVFSFACHSPLVAQEIYDIMNDKVSPLIEACILVRGVIMGFLMHVPRVLAGPPVAE